MNYTIDNGTHRML
jgi:hypothetical protein